MTIALGGVHDVAFLDDNVIYTTSIVEDLEDEEISAKGFSIINDLFENLEHNSYKCFVVDYHLNQSLNGVDVIKTLLLKDDSLTSILFTGNSTQLHPDEIKFLKQKKIPIVEKPNIVKLIKKIQKH